MGEITIRLATAGDLNQLAALRLALRSRGSANLESDEAFLKRCEAWMAKALAQPAWHCWVADNAGVLIGAIWLRRVEKIPNPISESEQLGYITNFFIAESARGQGLGSRMLEEVLAWSRDHQLHSLILWPTDRSRTLYQRYGFDIPDNVFVLTLGES